MDGVQYTVTLLGFEKSHSNVGFNFIVKPAIPFDFTLTLGRHLVALQRRYCKFESWRCHALPLARNNKPELGRWGPCRRGTGYSAHRHLRPHPGRGRRHRGGNPFLRLLPHGLSPSTCRTSPSWTSQAVRLRPEGRRLRGAVWTEILDLSGYSLGGHTWNQLPVGLFDGLDNLEVLDLSDTIY